MVRAANNSGGPDIRRRLHRPHSPMIKVGVVLSFLLVTTTPGWAAAADTLPRIPTGWGVDTSRVAGEWVSRSEMIRDRQEIYRMWSEYLVSRAESPVNRHSSPFWSTEEQIRWPDFDLTWFVVQGRLFNGFRPTVIEINPVRPGSEDVYVIRTLFSAVVSGETRPEVKPLALTRVYAVREGGEWVLSGALERITRGWQRRTVGPIEYVFPPDYSFDAELAQRAVRFSDSLAQTFDVPDLKDLTYFATSSSEEAYRIMGFDWVVRGSLTSGRSFPHNGLVIVGRPGSGEAHLHELVHMVLEPIAPVGSTHPLIYEGVATWLGGSLTLGPEDVKRTYAEFVRSNPASGLDRILAEGETSRELRPAGAALIEMVYSRQGIDAVKSLLSIEPSNAKLRSELMEILGMSWEAIDRAWKRTATASDVVVPF